MHLAKKFDCGVLSQYLAHCFTGVSNVEADRQSRTSQSQLEWTLNPKIFQESIHKLGVNPTNAPFCITDKLPTATASITLIRGLLRFTHSTCLGNVTFFMPSLHFALSLGCYRKFNKKSQRVSLWFPSGPHRFGGQS